MVGTYKKKWVKVGIVAYETAKDNEEKGDEECGGFERFK
jgi:hypothetical protein